MARWFPAILRRIRQLATQRSVRFTLKAQQELALLDWSFDAQDACDMLASLASRDFAGRLVSKITGEWMYVFKPNVCGAVLYIKLVLRADCLIVSFHEDSGEDYEENS
jgi:hypothetical protein